MKYIHSDQKVSYNCEVVNTESTDDESYKPDDRLELNLQNIIKLLIPAEFLKIETLWNECINFIG